MKRYRVVLAPSARRQLFAASDVWAVHHPNDPLVLVDEFDEATRHLETLPALGVVAVGTSVSNLRKILLIQSEHHVYYTVDDSQRVVEVLAVWYARRGSPPAL